MARPSFLYPFPSSGPAVRLHHRSGSGRNAVRRPMGLWSGDPAGDQYSRFLMRVWVGVCARLFRVRIVSPPVLSRVDSPRKRGRRSVSPPFGGEFPVDGREASRVRERSRPAGPTDRLSLAESHEQRPISRRYSHAHPHRDPDPRDRSYVPERVVTNAELSESLVSTPTGSSIGRDPRRRFAPPHHATSDLCLAAAQRCLKDADCDPSEIDLVIVGT